jgi:hypothetical protein
MATAAEMLEPQIVIRDRYVAMLLRAMASEVVQGCPGGALYAQALSLALATYLARKFPVKGAVSRAEMWAARPDGAPWPKIGR